MKEFYIPIIVCVFMFGLGYYFGHYHKSNDGREEVSFVVEKNGMSFHFDKLKVKKEDKQKLIDFFDWVKSAASLNRTKL